MKRLFVIALMAVICMTAGAQGKWRVNHREADPLVGKTAKDLYVFEHDSIGIVVVWDWDKPDFRVVSKVGLFVYKNLGYDVRSPIAVGIYDSQDNLVEKFSINMVFEPNTAYKSIVNPDMNKKGRQNMMKILKAMKSGDGYVRIVGGIYQSPDFDLKITPFDKQDLQE